MIPSRRTSLHPFNTIPESPNELFNMRWSIVNPSTPFNSNSMFLKTISSLELLTVNGISNENLIKSALLSESNTIRSPDFMFESERMVLIPSTLSNSTSMVSSLIRKEFPFNLDS